ncbi:VOC family protein [Streptomyces sp. NPDC026672]
MEALGGRRLELYDDGGFLVMVDPEGNEFCIIPDGAFEIDDEGHADYLG